MNNVRNCDYPNIKVTKNDYEFNAWKLTRAFQPIVPCHCLPMACSDTPFTVHCIP